MCLLFIANLSNCDAAVCCCSGVGAGSTEHIAHDAARKAAMQDRDVTVEGREGTAYGHPTGAAHTGSATGAGTSPSSILADH